MSIDMIQDSLFRKMYSDSFNKYSSNVNRGFNLYSPFDLFTINQFDYLNTYVTY